jgi:hypothetical protein
VFWLQLRLKKIGCTKPWSATAKAGGDDVLNPSPGAHARRDGAQLIRGGAHRRPMLYEDIFNSQLSGSAVYYAAWSLLVTFGKSCSKLHCQKDLNWKSFHMKFGGPSDVQVNYPAPEELLSLQKCPISGTNDRRAVGRGVAASLCSRSISWFARAMRRGQLLSHTLYLSVLESHPHQGWELKSLLMSWAKLTNHEISH